MRRRFILLAICLTALSLAATACGDGDGGGGSTATPGAAQTADVTRPPPRPTATPVPEGTRDDGATESPEAALRRQIGLLNTSEYGTLWDELHPAQQARVPRERFVDCLAPEDFVLTLEIVDTLDSVIDVPEVSQVPAKTIAARLSSGGTSLDRTFFQVLVDGQWRWVLEKAQFDAYSAGNCP
jgi:hypothetical protein